MSSNLTCTKPRKLDQHSGVILLEVMIAALIMVTGIVALLGYHFRVMEKSADSQSRQQAIALMTNEIALLYTRDYNEVQSYKTRYSIEEKEYDIHVVVSPDKTVPGKRIALLLSWQSGSTPCIWEENVFRGELYVDTKK